ASACLGRLDGSRPLAAADHRRHRPLRTRDRARVPRAALPGNHVPAGGSSMSTTAVIERPIPTRRSWELPGPRLARAEYLKLRARRGLMLASLALTVGAVMVAYMILLVLHLTDPAGHGPAGGREHFWNGMYLLTALGTMAAVLVGATAGAGDLSAGVFRS